MKKAPLILFLTVMLVLGFVLSNYSYVDRHEHIHSRIAERHGCLEDDITVKSWGLAGGKFECLDYLNRTDEVRREERILHTANDIVGQNLPVYVGMVFFVVFVIGVVIVLRD